MASLQLPVNAPKDTEAGEPGESTQAELRLNALGYRFCIIIPWRGFPMCSVHMSLAATGSE